MKKKELQSLISYDPISGEMYWKARRIETFPLPRIGKSWNARWAGKLVGSAHCRGYRETQINGEKFLLHQLAWLYVHGKFVEEIDHQDGDRTNNRISNLAAATRLTNGKNVKRRSDSTSGATGVYWHKRWGRWAAHIRVNGKLRYLGGFDDLEQARRARKSADALYGFHPNHGRTNSKVY